MSEREVVSVRPAIAPFAGPGISVGDESKEILHVIYSDGDEAYRCVVCSKEFPRYGQTWGHKTHHGRTRESYKHTGRSKQRKKDPRVHIEGVVRRILTTAISDIATDISDTLTGVSETETTRMQAEIDDLRISLAEEHAARVKSEKDLNKIKNLFK